MGHYKSSTGRLKHTHQDAALSSEIMIAVSVTNIVIWLKISICQVPPEGIGLQTSLQYRYYLRKAIIVPACYNFVTLARYPFFVFWDTSSDI